MPGPGQSTQSPGGSPTGSPTQDRESRRREACGLSTHSLILQPRGKEVQGAPSPAQLCHWEGPSIKSFSLWMKEPAFPRLVPCTAQRGDAILAPQRRAVGGGQVCPGAAGKRRPRHQPCPDCRGSTPPKDRSVGLFNFLGKGSPSGQLAAY